MLIYLFTLTSLVINIVQGQIWDSPCPDILKYEDRKHAEYNQWSAIVTFMTAEKLKGLSLTIILDNKADHLESLSANSAVTSDNIEYLLRGIFPFQKGKQICPSAPINTKQTPSPSYVGLITAQRSTTTTSRPNNTLPTVLLGSQMTSNREEESNRTMNDSLSSHGTKDDDQFFNGDFYVASTETPTSRRPVTVVREPVQCGTVAQRATPLISHSQTTTPGQWPWHAALYRQRGTELLYTCGGTLISQQFVVTVAHCVTKPRSNSLVDKQALVVYLGKYNLVSFRSEVQDRDIDQIIIHPEYNYTVFYNDIALLKLGSPVEFNDFVRPCCLWDDEVNDIENLFGHLGTVVGWGFDENKQLSRNLMQAQMPIVSTNKCLFSNRNFFSQFISDKNFCAGFKNGTSVCNGDSGGGMVIHKWSARGQNTLWQLRGLVSVGVALQGKGVCDTNQYVVFTDAAKYVQWIRHETN